MAGDLLQTKLYVPQRPGDRQRHTLVPRPHLIDKLNAGLDGKLTLISAPAGFGKTTLLCDWVSQSQIPICWYALDENDNDLGRFLSYLIASLQSIHIEIDKQILTLLQSHQTSKIEALLIPILNQISIANGRFALVLDDYHLIQSQDVHDALTYMLEHLPPNMLLMMASRADPPLPLARLRARGQLNEIRADDLRFSIAEGEAFLSQALDYQISEQSIHTLVNRTEGWVSALKMAALSLRVNKDPESFINTFAGNYHYIFDYLTDEVLKHQPEATKMFLFQTSILERLSGPLCDAVTEGREGQQTVEMLQGTNIFIAPLDEKRVWFRYHSLFADMLYQRLQQAEPEKISALHRRAGAWFEENGFWHEAVNHAIQAGDYDRAAETIEKVAESTLLHGEIKTFLRWVNMLPETAVRQRPLLSLYHAETLLLSGQSIAHVSERMKDVTEHIGLQVLMSAYQGNLERSLMLFEQAQGELPENSYFIKSAISSTLAAIMLMSGDVTQAIQQFTDSVENAKFGKNLLLEVIGTTRIAQLLMISGNLSAAKARCQHAWELAKDRKGQYLPLASFPLYYWAYLSFQCNNLGDALAHARQAVELSNKYGGFWGIDCYITYALILQALGEHGEAIEAMQTARNLSQETSANPFDDLYTAAFEAQLWIAQGQLDAASQWARQRNLITLDNIPPGLSKQRFFHFQELEFIILARLYIAKRNPDAALNVLTCLAEHMVQLSRQGNLIENYLLQALAYQLKGNRQGAMSKLTEALSFVESEGAIRVFINERPVIDPLLHALISNDIESELAKKLLSVDALQLLEKAQPKALEFGERLSGREIEVLRLLASDLPVPELATNLVISVSTLRTHIRNIYRKLDTHSRFEAVSKAQALNII